jgi:hypothetical protein
MGQVTDVEVLGQASFRSDLAMKGTLSAAMVAGPGISPGFQL